MADGREFISAADVEFDAEGRGFIKNAGLVGRLKGSVDDAAIKNIGCCSIADIARDPQFAEALMKLDQVALKNIGCCSAPAVDSKLDDRAIKNIGCCSVTDIARDPSFPEALRSIGDAAIKNVGCCSAPADFGGDVTSPG